MCYLHKSFELSELLFFMWLVGVNRLVLDSLKCYMSGVNGISVDHFTE